MLYYYIRIMRVVSQCFSGASGPSGRPIVPRVVRLLVPRRTRLSSRRLSLSVVLSSIVEHSDDLRPFPFYHTNNVLSIYVIPRGDGSVRAGAVYSG